VAGRPGVGPRGLALIDRAAPLALGGASQLLGEIAGDRAELVRRSAGRSATYVELRRLWRLELRRGLSPRRQLRLPIQFRTAALNLRPCQHRRDRLDLLQLIGKGLANRRGGLSGLLRQTFHAALHFLAQRVEVRRRLLPRVAPPPRPRRPLPAPLFALAP